MSAVTVAVAANLVTEQCLLLGSAPGRFRLSVTGLPGSRLGR